ncbi:tail fiber assembly protein [Pantoea eucrina]|uniref:tail fiber assembly protein n=1 Tax=Pantoea eucrina TaxID=472693 RepID=UPI00080F48B4|nr:tail fiber assembly protein [Pantoea eucrina]
MAFFYSPNSNMFFDGSMVDAYKSAGSWPADAKKVSDDVFREYTGTPPSGKVRVSNGKGPEWADIPPPTKEEMVALAENEKAKLISYASEKILPLQDAIDLDMANESEVEQLSAWKRYRVLINRVDVINAPEIKWPEQPK